MISNLYFIFDTQFELKRKEKKKRLAIDEVGRRHKIALATVQLLITKLNQRIIYLFIYLFVLGSIIN